MCHTSDIEEIELRKINATAIIDSSELMERQERDRIYREAQDNVQFDALLAGVLQDIDAVQLERIRMHREMAKVLQYRCFPLEIAEEAADVMDKMIDLQYALNAFQSRVNEFAK